MVSCGLLWRPQMKDLIFVEMNAQEVVLCVASDHLVNVVVWTSEPLTPEAKRPALEGREGLRYQGGYLFGLTQSNILSLLSAASGRILCRQLGHYGDSAGLHPISETRQFL
jgi:hypothetical protein